MMNKNYGCIPRPSDDDLSIICSNIGKALSIIYSKRLGMKITIACVPKKEGDSNGREHKSVSKTHESESDKAS